MATDLRLRMFTASLPRPASVTEWSDTEVVTSERLGALVDTLEGDWETEGPLFEGGALRADAWRKVDDVRTHSISLELFPSEDGQDMPEAPPALLRFSVCVQEEDAREELRHSKLISDGIMGFAALATGYIGYAAWRHFGSVSAAGFTALIAFVVLFVAALFADRAITRMVYPPGPPAPPSQAFLALVAKVEQHLRDASPFVDIQAT